jgi:hypothetical protein
VTKAKSAGKIRAASAASVAGQCLCGTVQIEIDFPARWAWHDHSSATRHAHGSAYATYIGSWRRRFRVTKGLAKITHFRDETTGTARSFCARCGTPLIYERARSAHMVNIPRALHGSGTPLSHCHRRTARLDISGRTTRSAKGLSRSRVGAPDQEEAARDEWPPLTGLVGMQLSFASFLTMRPVTGPFRRVRETRRERN